MIFSRSRWRRLSIYIVICSGCFFLFPLLLHYHIPNDTSARRDRFFLIKELTHWTKIAQNALDDAHTTDVYTTDADTTQNVSTTQRKCEDPNDWLYPLCAYKVWYIQLLWQTNTECFIKKHGMVPTDTCSVFTFLSEVEHFCPRLPWRQVERKTLQKQAVVRHDVEGLHEILKEKKYKWMRSRISRLWPHWVNAAKSYALRNPQVGQHHVKDILIFTGAYAFDPLWFEFVDKGAPLGEMVQWTDLIVSLYILGHNLTICSTKPHMKSLFQSPTLTGCADQNQRDDFDLIYTDIVGTYLLKQHLGPNFSKYRCKCRLLDSFGTEAEFNYAEYEGSIPGGKSEWGNGDFLLQQLFTMFPHSPDNLFLGFVVGPPVPEDVKPLAKKPIGLVYGKEPNFWENKTEYLDVLNKYLEIHATVGHFDFTLTKKKNTNFVPDYVKMHGILNGTQFAHLLQEAKVFIGLGFPYEGPAPLEAIAQGCVFLNGKLDPPHSRLNTDFFKFKPTLRELTSQHPYAEMAIGKPHVYTLDLSKISEVEEAIKEILKTEVKPYLPFEWTPEGMLERVHVFTEKLNFCDHSSERWPPLEYMQKYLGRTGQSCKDVCLEHGLLCEPSYFRDLNSMEILKSVEATCLFLSVKKSLFAPSFNPATRSCVLQAQSLLFSCVAREPELQRLCPCRDYQPQQMALCKNCG